MVLGIPRRGFLRVALGALGVGLLSGCARVMSWVLRADNSKFTPVSHSFETSDLCALNAEAVPGPFYVEKAWVRRSIAEGHAGVPLRVRFKVVDVAAGCAPLPGAAVEVWHCDAEGIYSGYASYPPDEFPAVGLGDAPDPTDGERFCRGIQFADAEGMVEFETIVPGWYTPRTPHIHMRVSMPRVTADDGTLGAHVLTNQAYFPDALTAEVYGVSPYTARGGTPYTNQTDFVIHESGGADGGFLRMTRTGEGWLGTLTLGVDIDAGRTT